MELHSDSTYSLGSDVSVSTMLIPKPPDGPKPTRKDTKRRSRVASSPYLTTIKQHSTSLKSTSATVGSTGSGWKSFDEVVRAAATQQAATSAFLKSLHKSTSTEAIDTARKRRRLHLSELGHINQSNGAIGGQPAGPAAEYNKSCEEMYDEIVELKKALNSVTSERDLVKAKVVQLDKLLVKRDKQVEDMLASGYVGNHEVTRTLAGGRKIDTTVLTSLKQKIHMLERNLREKESAVSKLSANMKVSRVEEAELKAETYYLEVCRLKEILQQQSRKVEELLSISFAGDVVSRLAILNAAVIKLSEQKKSLHSSKKHLEEKLKQCTATIEHGETGIRGPIADKHADLQRAEMLSRIVDMELEMKEKENTITSLCKEFEEKQLQYEEKIAGLVSNLSESNSQSIVVQYQLTEAEKKKDKLKTHLKQLKNDKIYYQEQEKSKSQEAEEVRAALHTQSASVEQLQSQMKDLQGQLGNEEKAREHARLLQKKRMQVVTSTRAQRHEAATVIQENWRKLRSTKKQKKFDDDLTEDITVVQSAIRAHLYQKNHLQSQVSESEYVSDQEDGNASTEEAVETIQSALRGHLTRHHVLNNDLPDSSNKQTSPNLNEQVTNNDVISVWKYNSISAPVHTRDVMNTEHVCEDQQDRKRINLQPITSHRVMKPLSFRHHMSSSDEDDAQIAGIRKNLSSDSIIEMLSLPSQSDEATSFHLTKEMQILSDEL